MVNLDAEGRKRDLRHRFKADLDRFVIDKSQKKIEMDGAVVDGLVKILSILPGPVGLFKAMSSEPDLSTLKNRSMDRPYCYPRMENERLTFWQPKTGDAFEVGPFGVSEPILDESEPMDLGKVAVICIPAIAFDRWGARLGRGKAFYDRSLKNFKGKKIGVGYTVQISDEPLPTESHDIQMDYIVTENFILQPKGQ